MISMRKNKNLEKNLHQCHFANHESHFKLPATEPGSPLRENSNWLSKLWHGQTHNCRIILNYKLEEKWKKVIMVNVKVLSTVEIVTTVTSHSQNSWSIFKPAISQMQSVKFTVWQLYITNSNHLNTFYLYRTLNILLCEGPCYRKVNHHHHQLQGRPKRSVPFT
jgi:hypothetical protein